MGDLFLLLAALVGLIGFFCVGFLVVALITPPIRYAGKRPGLLRRIIDKLDSI